MLPNEKNEKFLELLLNYSPAQSHPVIFDMEKNSIYSGEYKNFVDFVAFLNGNHGQDENNLDMIKGLNLKALYNTVEYDFEHKTDINEKTQDKLENIVTNKYVSDEFSNDFCILMLGDYLASKYQGEQSLALSYFINDNKDKIKQLAGENELFNLAMLVIKRAEMVDEILEYKNKSTLLNYHKLELFPFEVDRFKGVADKVVSTQKSLHDYKTNQERTYIEQSLYVSDERLKANPLLKRLINRETVYFYAAPEKSDFNVLTNGNNSNRDFRNDPNTIIKVKRGNKIKEQKIYRYDSALGVYYTYKDFLNPEYMQKNGFIGNDYKSLADYEMQISQLKSRWLTLSVAIPSPEHQKESIIGSSVTRGNRITLEGERKSHIQTNENKIFHRTNAGLFNAETLWTIYDFKTSETHKIILFDTIKCLSMQGFGDSATTFKDFIVDINEREKYLKKQIEKQELEDREKEASYLERSKELTAYFNSLPSNKDETAFPYFITRGVDTREQKCIVRFDLAKRIEKDENSEKILSAVIPYFAFDNKNKLRLFTTEIIKPIHKDDGSIGSFKKKAQGARAKGAFAVAGVDSYSDIESIWSKKRINVAEGFATALAVSKITGEPCLACGSIHNFVDVVKSIEKYIDKKATHFNLCIDNDCFKYIESDLNTSISNTKDYIADNKFPQSTTITPPIFLKDEKKGSDWADKLANKGLKNTAKDFQACTMSLDDFSQKCDDFKRPISESETISMGLKP